MAPNTTSAQAGNPNEHLGIPKWINADYFLKLLDKDLPNYSQIVKFTPIAATAPGDNYTSIMVRVLIDVALKDGSTTQISYILKTMLDASNSGAVFVHTMNLFPKEKQMYQTILPQFVALYKEVGVDVKFGPTCLHVDETPERITLVMEDLKRQDFVNADRLKGFDMAHMTCVLHKLAELHAASARYYELNGPYDDMYQTSFFNEANRPIFDAMAAGRNASFLAAMREWGLDDVEYYQAKMPKPDAYFDEGLRMNVTDPNGFNVLNHGDCWVNNIMFNYQDNGDIKDSLFVDFQIGKWGPPTHDLWYLIVTSASLDIKIKEFDHFVSIYHKRLVECLKLLNCTRPIPSLKALHVMMLKYGFWGLVTANGVLSAVLLPSDKDSNMDNMMKPGKEGDEFRYKTFVNPYYARAMRQLCPFFANKGILDVALKP